MKIFIIFGVHRKIQCSWGKLTKTKYIGGLSKKGRLGQLTDYFFFLGGGESWHERGVLFLRGELMHTIGESRN